LDLFVTLRQFLENSFLAINAEIGLKISRVRNMPPWGQTVILLARGRETEEIASDL